MGNEVKPKDARTGSHIIAFTSNVCACVSGAVLALVSVNVLTQQALETDPPASGAAASMSSGVRLPHRLLFQSENAPQRSVPGSAAPAALFSPQVEKLASIEDQRLETSAHAVGQGTGELLAWSVHLTASWTRGKALKQYSTIRSKYPEVLSGKPPVVVRLSNHSMGTAERYAVRIGLQDREGARRLCARLQNAGGACVVYRSARR